MGLLDDLNATQHLAAAAAYVAVCFAAGMTIGALLTRRRR